MGTSLSDLMLIKLVMQENLQGFYKITLASAPAVTTCLKNIPVSRQLNSIEKLIQAPDDSGYFEMLNSVASNPSITEKLNILPMSQAILLRPG